MKIEECDGNWNFIYEFKIDENWYPCNIIEGSEVDGNRVWIFTRNGTITTENREDIIDLDTAPRTIWIRLKSREQNLSEVQYIKGICAKPSIKHDMVKIYYSEEKVTDLAAWSNSKEIMDSLYKQFPKEDVKITI